MHTPVPYLSFTFDDFPRSALLNGGAILDRYGLRATYFASFGLMGTEAPTGAIFLPDDIRTLYKQGHELACHTFAHHHSWETSAMVFEASIVENRRALERLVPGASFTSFSYPITSPCPSVKRIVARHFRCCRSGGQTFNSGTIDLNLLKAYFLEQAKNDLDVVKNLIDLTVRACGWLILATHDIAQAPTRYGCTPSFFKNIVEYGFKSGAKILPVSEAFDAVCAREQPVIVHHEHS